MPAQAGANDGQETILMEDAHWREVFGKYDVNGDGQISFPELCAAIKGDKNINNIPESTVRQLMAKADDDNSGFLNYEEFVLMLNNPENKKIFGHLGKYMSSYISLARPKRKRSEGDEQDKGEYEDQYTCCPPALGMVLASVIEIITFMYDAIADGETMALGTVAKVLIYSPYKRYEAWRYMSYMFIHVGYVHLFVNLIVQIMLGIPLEMVHKGWRVAVVYLAGVLAGSLGTSITSPRVFLAGASGGVYALITAHVATIIMNWKEMQYAIYQLLVFLVLCTVDVGSAMYNQYVLKLDDKVGYSAHLFGAIAGLLVSILVLRNIDVLRWEKILWWACLVIYTTLMIAAIAWNAASPDYFPRPR